MSWKARGISYGRADDNVGSVGYADYSRAGNTTRLELTICHSNPMEKKIYEQLVKSIDQRKKQREASLYHNQRLFFIQQVFEKGLNPYLKRGESDTEDAEEEDEQAERDEVKEVIQEEQKKEELNSKEEVRMMRPRSSSLPTIRRSHTTMVNTSQESKPSNGNDGQPLLPGLTRSKTGDVSNEFKRVSVSEKPETNTVLPHIAVNEDNSKLAMKLAKPSMLKLQPLGARPSDLIRKGSKLELDGVQHHDNKEGTAEPEVHAQTARQHPPKPTKQVSFLRSKIKKKAEEDGTADQSAATVKLIQKLTTYLPPHLAETAKTQIRQMSKSDAIYDCKQKLLEQNRSSLESRSTADPRWSKLEGALSETFGGVRWRKLNGRHNWIQYKETL